MGKRNLYLKTIPVEEAQALYQDALKAIAVRRTEKIPVEESLGRMTAKAIYARCLCLLYVEYRYIGDPEHDRKHQSHDAEYPARLCLAGLTGT